MNQINETMESLAKIVSDLQAEHDASPKAFYKADGPERVAALKSKLEATVVSLHRLPNHRG